MEVVCQTAALSYCPEPMGTKVEVGRGNPEVSYVILPALPLLYLDPTICP